MIPISFIATGGFIGAICRYWLANLIKKKNRYRLPLGTLLVNLIGSFLLGFLYGFTNDNDIRLLLGIGFLGAFTTFSTFNLETMQLLEGRERLTAFIYLALTYIGGIVFAFAGFMIGKI